MKDKTLIAFLTGIAIGASAILLYENKKEILSKIENIKDNYKPRVDYSESDRENEE